eukprot:1152548-Pelagomonas_calceolata.AAC.3
MPTGKEASYASTGVLIAKCCAKEIWTFQEQGGLEEPGQTSIKHEQGQGISVLSAVSYSLLIGVRKDAKADSLHSNYIKYCTNGCAVSRMQECSLTSFTKEMHIDAIVHDEIQPNGAIQRMHKMWSWDVKTLLWLRHFLSLTAVQVWPR